MIEKLKFLTHPEVLSIAGQFGTPVFVYDEASLVARAREALAFPHAFGLTVRFAMKALPNAAVLRLFRREGLHFDASSGWECRRAMAAGIEPHMISLSTQELPDDIADLLAAGVEINLCSLSQIERVGAAVPGARVGIRFNPGLGSGSTGKTNVGGPSSSFGIWHESVADVVELARRFDLNVVRIHSHIGSGSDPDVWSRVVGLTLALVEQFPSADSVNLGGGYKVARMSSEKATDLQLIGRPVQEAFEALASCSGRRLKLEIEPGTFLVANAGALVSTVQDKVATGGDGNTFLKLDCGMTEVLRPSLYAAQHPLVVVPREGGDVGTERVVVVGHCCESGDLLSPSASSAEELGPRQLTTAKIGDLCVVEGVGAYCSAMSTKNYNSFPEAAEVLKGTDGAFHLIRRRQKLDQIIENETLPDFLK